jgi:hypothetical protein
MAATQFWSDRFSKIVGTHQGTFLDNKDSRSYGRFEWFFGHTLLCSGGIEGKKSWWNKNWYLYHERANHITIVGSFCFSARDARFARILDMAKLCSLLHLVCCDEDQWSLSSYDLRFESLESVVCRHVQELWLSQSYRAFIIDLDAQGMTT